MWKRIELAAIAYRKNPSVETGDDLMKAIYRTERKDLTEKVISGFENPDEGSGAV